jgi:hypothetical protein
MWRRTRRELIGRGAVLVGAGLAAVPTAAQAAKPIPSDGELIAMLAGLELLVAFVYQRALGSGRLTDAEVALARQIQGHELAHARALLALLPALGAQPPQPPRDDVEAQAALVPHHTHVVLARVRGAHGWLHLLIDIEQVLERNYHQAISQLREAELLRLCAEILASEGQHGLLLTELRHPGKIDRWLGSPFLNGD